MPKMTKKFKDWYYKQTGFPFILPVMNLAWKAYQKGIREGKEKNQPFSGIRKLTKKTLHTSRS